MPCAKLMRSWQRCRQAATRLGFVTGLLLSVPIHASQPPAIPWTSAVSFGGTGNDLGDTVKVDREGNRYVTGAFSATAYFPTVALSDPHSSAQTSQSGSQTRSLVSNGDTDAFLAKYDSSGSLKWLIRAGGPAQDHAVDVAFDGAGNIYVTGWFSSNAAFQGLNGTAQSVTGTANTIFLAKYTGNGELAWVQTGTAAFGTNQGYSVAVDSITGSVYITGVSQGDTTFSSSNGTSHSVPGPFTWHMVLAKYDIHGAFQWGQSNQASPNSVARRVAVDLDANVYVTGWMEAGTTFHSNDGHDQTVEGFSEPVQSAPDYPGDGFLVKYDENGNLQWVNHVGGYKAIPVDIASSRDGKISITGFIGNLSASTQQAQTIVTSQPGGKNINLGGGTLTRPFNKDAFFATYNASGVLLEARRFGGAADEGGTGIAYDKHGNLTLAGLFKGALQIGGQTLIGKTALNLFVATFAQAQQMCTPTPNTSRLAWVHTAGGIYVPSYETGPRVDLTSYADAVVTGEYQSTAQFSDSITLHTAGSTDGFVALLQAP
ncbi:MAG: hypothetical protein JSR66_00125 [Proteobacteria bacterium]|nr:hypothetical protein [Pseudomonadota bacterium]